MENINHKLLDLYPEMQHSLQELELGEEKT